MKPYIFRILRRLKENLADVEQIHEKILSDPEEAENMDFLLNEYWRRLDRSIDLLIKEFDGENKLGV